LLLTGFPDIKSVQMNRVYHATLANFGFLLACGLLAAPGFPQASLDACQHRTISMAVIDRAWAPVRELKPEDFRAEFKGRPVKVISVQPDERPRNIVILVDASGSMAKSERSPGTWRLSLSLASDLPRLRLKNTHYALLVFNETIVERVDFSDDDTAVLRKLQEIAADPAFEKTNVRKRTALWDTAATAARLFRDFDSANLIYAITDGGDNHSSLSLDNLKRQLSAAGVRFYVSMVDAPTGNRGRAPEEENGPADLNEITSATGGIAVGPVVNTGRSFALPAANALNISGNQLLGNFYRSMLTGYLIEIEFPDMIAKRGRLKLALTKEKHAALKDSSVSYGRDLEPCVPAGATR